jgi:thiamine biosynthesis lipoprotein ApbE
VCHAALGASGLRKGDHILEPRSGESVRGRLAAWVSVPRPEAPRDAVSDMPRVAAAAVADALTTAFMILRPEDIEALCRRIPEIEAWVLPGPAAGASLLHFGGSSG